MKKAKYNSTLGKISLSNKDCSDVSDQVVIGAFMHEVAHAFQYQKTPNNLDAIEYAGDALPCRMRFALEEAALLLERAKRNIYRL